MLDQQGCSATRPQIPLLTKEQAARTAFTVHYLFFAWVHKSALFLVVVFGTASLATIRNATPVLPILITLVGTIDLVFE
jgi:hypothetical protein